MSPEERQLLQGLFDRMRNNANTPRDRDAEQMITDNVGKQPYAPYLLAQTVIVQDQALQAANERLQQLEQQLQEQQAPPQQQSGGGFLSGLFGGGASHQAPPPPSSSRWNQGGTGYPPPGSYPQQGGYPPQGGYPQQGFAPPPPQAGMSGGPWGGMQQQPAGGSFLHGALGTAAGVAGGVLAADAIGSLFRSGHAGGGLGIASGVPGFGGGTGGETITNNYYGDSNAAGGNQSADAQQDAKDYNLDDTTQNANWSQDANQDQDAAQDLGDYDVNDDGGF